MSNWSVHDVLVAGGVPVLDARVPGRPGEFDPVGMLIHHTGNPSPGDLPSLKLLQKGRADLPGPLCQLGGGRKGTIAAVTDGKANHAGKGSRAAYERLRSDLEPVFPPGPDDWSDGNARYVGLEIENAGNGKDAYPEVQWKACVKACAVLCLARGWSPNRNLAHKEHTKRKPDPSFDMKAFRLDVSRQMYLPTPEPGEPEMEPIIYRTRDDNGGNVSEQLYVTDRFTTQYMNEAAFTHGKNLGWWGNKPGEMPEIIEIPESLHEWLADRPGSKVD